MPENTINPYAQAGVYALSGGADIASDISGTVGAYKDMNTTVSRPEAVYGVKPSYGLSDELDKLAGLKTDLAENNVGKGLIGRSMVKGATTGLSAGVGFGGIGGLIGAGAGALGGLVAGIFGKKKAKQEAEDRAAELQAGIKRQQDSYNNEVSQYYQTGSQRDAYGMMEQRKANRMYNIPSYTSLY